MRELVIILFIPKRKQVQYRLEPTVIARSFILYQQESFRDDKTMYPFL